MWRIGRAPVNVRFLRLTRQEEEEEELCVTEKVLCLFICFRSFFDKTNETVSFVRWEPSPLSHKTQVNLIGRCGYKPLFYGFLIWFTFENTINYSLLVYFTSSEYVCKGLYSCFHLSPTKKKISNILDCYI